VTSTSEAAFTSFHQKAALFPTGKSKFKPIVSAINSDSVDMTCRRRSQHILIRRFYLFATPPDTPDKNDIEVVTLGEDDTVSDKVWEEVEASAPSELTVMKELLGINVFTYILGAAIVFFLTMNAVLGPGWLGQVTGVPGTGTFTEVSESLPNNMDLNNPENLLN